jgi:DNA-directed RNA polymerase beta subunit
MIPFKNLRQYTHVTRSIRFPQNISEPFVLIYFSENSTLIDDYPKLNLRPVDFRIAVVPQTTMPRTLLTSDMKKIYKAYNLIAYSSRQRVPPGKNVIFDVSQYINEVDQRFKPTTYRQRAGFLIKDVIKRAAAFFPDNYQKILLYSVDATKDFNAFPNRKVFPIVQELKSEDLYYDHLLFSIINEEGARYRLLVKDRDYKFSRVLQILRSVKSISIEEEQEEEERKLAKKVMNVVGDQIDQNKEVVASAIGDFINQDPELMAAIRSGKAKKGDIRRAAAGAILFKVSGDYARAKRISTNIPPNKAAAALKAVSQSFADDLLKPEKAVSLSTDPRIKTYQPDKMNDGLSPNHIFQKRQIDFEKNLINDLRNSFKVLEGRDIPLKFESISVNEKPARKGEIMRSDLNIATIKLKDKFGNIQEVQVELPRINPNTGTFRINGRTKCLINQLVQDPITFPSPGVARFESSYSKFRIESKILRNIKYLQVFISQRFPMLFLLAFSFGFDNTMKKYGLSYKISNEKPAKGTEHWAKIKEDQYIIFEKINNELKEQLVKSFIHGKPEQYSIDSEFPSYEYFEKLIIAVTGRINAPYMINNNLENIVDPVAKQVLKTKGQPTDLENIMKYMAERVMEGYTIQRNDLTNQRIRNSEVLVHLIQKQILAAYTVYREQMLSGNEEAKIDIHPTKTLSDFLQTENVVDMEYANPIEEMSTITRLSPVGKKVGGIPDKRAIDPLSRNIHESHFGNIDPLDTPESGNIGLVQQLTIDAMITSSRGLFAEKKISDKEYAGALSTTSAMTPFLENNDGARVIMLTNQAKQMLPLKNPEPPVVQSGFESILSNVVSENFIKKSPCTGKVTKVTNSIIEVTCSDGKKQEVDISPMHLRSGTGKNTLSVFKPLVTVGRRVKSKDVLAEGACMSNGTISLGRPLLIGFMPYKGYNFEDGIVINEKLVDQDKLTSLHGIEEEVMLSEEDRLISMAKIGDQTARGSELLRKSIGEIEQLIGYEEDDDSDIYAGQYVRKSPGGTIVDIEVFSNVSEDTFPELKTYIRKTNKKYGKPAAEKFKIKGKTIKGVMIVFRIEQELKIDLGDKLCNRYGNKGIISLVEKDSLMPRTPFGTLDIIMNPIGILSRMNMGQVYEMYCGLIAKELGNRVPKLTKAETVKLIRNIYSNLDASKNKEFTKTLTANIEKLSASDYKLFVENIKRSGFYPIIVPPFKAPDRKQIANALKILGLKAGYKLRLPEFNRSTEREVPIGYMYISKLEHMGEAKIYGRSTGPTTGKTAQPTAGKRREGGQRLGEGDTYAFISYDCINTLAELMGPLSDDYITRDEIVSEIIQKGSAEFRPAKISPARDLLNSYFISLMLERG